MPMPSTDLFPPGARNVGIRWVLVIDNHALFRIWADTGTLMVSFGHHSREFLLPGIFIYVHHYSVMPQT